jgi:hypothetical protein
LDYLIGEKLFHFVQAAEHPEFAAELSAFVAETQRLFTALQIREYLVDLEKSKYLAPREPDLDLDDLDEEDDEELWLDNPVTSAKELLRFLPPPTPPALAAIIIRSAETHQRRGPRDPFRDEVIGDGHYWVAHRYFF